MNNTTNIMIVGVGGQGTLLASRILGNAVIRADAKHIFAQSAVFGRYILQKFAVSVGIYLVAVFFGINVIGILGYPADSSVGFGQEALDALADEQLLLVSVFTAVNRVSADIQKAVLGNVQALYRLGKAFFGAQIASVCVTALYIASANEPKPFVIIIEIF